MQEPEADEPHAPPERDHAENRVVVKFYWQQRGSPTNPSKWKGRHGLISWIRNKMGASDAPSMQACERTLVRLAEDEIVEHLRRTSLWSTRAASCPTSARSTLAAACGSAPPPLRPALRLRRLGSRRIYEPSPVVRTVADARNNVLRTEAKSMLLGVWGSGPRLTTVCGVDCKHLNRTAPYANSMLYCNT